MSDSSEKNSIIEEAPDTQPETTPAEKAQERTKFKVANKKGRVFVKNLIFDINEKILRKQFGKYGDIVDIHIPINPANNKPKGFAFVEFANKNCGLKAINEWNGKKFKGRVLEMNLAEEKTRFTKGDESEDSQKEEDFEDVEKKFEDAEVMGEEGEAEGSDDEFGVNGLEQGFEDQEESVEDPEDQQDPDVVDDGMGEEDEDVVEKVEYKRKTSEERAAQSYDATIFVRNIPLEVDEMEFGQFFSKMGKIFYAKIVKRAGEEDHNGTGFIKFKDHQIAAKLIKISEEMSRGNYKPADDDPVLEMEGEVLLIYPTLSRGDIKGKLDWRTDMKAKKDKGIDLNPKNRKALKQIKNIQQLVDMDKTGKRKIALAIRGQYQPEDRMVKTPTDKEQREAHTLDKLEKLKNPNFFVSDKKIFLKNIDKSLDESGLKQLALDTLDMKKVTRKILRKVKVYTSEETKKSKGVAHQEFMQETDALIFMEKLETSDELWKLYNLKRVPIIEFSQENAQKVLKHERVLSSVVNKRVERKQGIMDERVKTGAEKRVDEKKKAKFDEVKKIKKDQIGNNKQIVKLRIAEIEAGTLKPTQKQVDEMVELAHGRGPRQRLRKRLVRLGIAESIKGLGDGPKVDPAQAKAEFVAQRRAEVVMAETNKEQYKEMMKEKQKVARQADMLKKRMPEEERQIAKQVKGKKKAKARAEEADGFDELADNYVKKKVKTAKWFS